MGSLVRECHYPEQKSATYINNEQVVGTINPGVLIDDTGSSWTNDASADPVVRVERALSTELGF